MAVPQTSMSAEAGRIGANTTRCARTGGAATTAPAPGATDPQGWGAPASVRPSCPVKQLQKGFRQRICWREARVLSTSSACQSSQETVCDASSLLPVCLPSSSSSSLPLLLTRLRCCGYNVPLTQRETQILQSGSVWLPAEESRGRDSTG